MITANNLRVLNDKVLFYWVDDIEKEFACTSGIILSRKKARTKERWGRIVGIGPDVAGVSIGEYIQPVKTHEPFGANYVIDIEGQSIDVELWCCTTDNILVVTDDVNDTHAMNGSPLLFDLNKKIKEVDDDSSPTTN